MLNNNEKQQNNYRNDPIIQSFLARIPGEIATTFTDTQLAELKKVFTDSKNTSSSVDIKLSIPFFKRRFYLVFLMGKERRSLERLQKSNFKVINTFLGTTYILAMLTIILGGGGYLIQEKIRIDSFRNTPINQTR
jgi:hypothetical protein